MIGTPSAGALHRFAHQAMRTQFELAIVDDLPAASARAIAEEIFADIDATESLISAFRPGADLQRINSAGAGVSVRVDPRVIDFLQKAADLVDQTQGAFDPTVGPVLALLRKQETPTPAALAQACQSVGFARQVKIDPGAGTVTLASPGARLDPGALGKGYALDRTMALLDDLGVRNALIHAGTSSVATRGAANGGSGTWPVAIAAPPDGTPSADPLAVVQLASVAGNGSLSVSAVQGQALHWPDGRTGHVVDPRHGGPAAGARLAAVVAEQGAFAEAWSTALLCLGPPGLPVLSGHDPRASALVLPADGPPAILGHAFTLKA